MEIKARHMHKNGHKTHLFKIMKERERTRLQSGVWARALEREDEMAVHLIDRAIEALGAGIASAVNLLDVSSVVVGGGLGTRLGRAVSWPASGRRCSRTCSWTRTRPTWPARRSGTWAARSAPRCWCRRALERLGH